MVMLPAPGKSPSPNPPFWHKLGNFAKKAVMALLDVVAMLCGIATQPYVVGVAFGALAGAILGIIGVFSVNIEYFRSLAGLVIVILGCIVGYGFAEGFGAFIGVIISIILMYQTIGAIMAGMALFGSTGLILISSGIGIFSAMIGLIVMSNCMYRMTEMKISILAGLGAGSGAVFGALVAVGLCLSSLPSWSSAWSPGRGWPTVESIAKLLTPDMPVIPVVIGAIVGTMLGSLYLPAFFEW